ncbi:hypothetical protein [Microbacterium sp. 3J1]|uniref:hypothetical protein n=1 Tax=Microbacterium sp. 3J1 TaxID=861269 RepID=UPI000B29381A|nr:hypothetical protein [Microbacterium sp. 3J1]
MKVPQLHRQKLSASSSGSRRGTSKIVVLVMVAGSVSLGLAACAPPEQSAEERAREIAERWIDASQWGDEESAQELSCGPILGGVNSDMPELESHTLDVTPHRDGQFVIRVTKVFSDYPDLVTNLGVRTDGELCISWVR